MARNDNAIAEISALLNKSAEPVKEIQEEEVVDTGAEAVIDEGEEVVETEEIEDGEVEDSEPRTLNQLAEAIEVDMDYLYGVEIGMGDNQAPIPLGQLKDKYQESVRSNQQLQEQLEAQTSKMEESQASVQQQSQVSEQVQQAQQAIYQVNKEFNDIDWERFESEDPGNAALTRQKFMERHQQAQGFLQQASQQQQQAEQDNRRAMGSKLMELIPEWQDATVRETEQAEIRTALLAAGYTQNMLANANDPIAISLVHRLLKAEKQISGANAEVKKVRKAPKVLRGEGGRFAAKSSQAVNDAVSNAKQSPNKHTELAAAKALLGMK